MEFFFLKNNRLLAVPRINNQKINFFLFKIDFEACKCELVSKTAIWFDAFVDLVCDELDKNRFVVCDSKFSNRKYVKKIEVIVKTDNPSECLKQTQSFEINAEYKSLKLAGNKLFGGLLEDSNKCISYHEFDLNQPINSVPTKQIDFYLNNYTSQDVSL